jgi:multidrug efflux pump subunit AcrB
VGKLSREKGAAWERELGHMLSDIWPDAKRGIQQTRSASEEADCSGTPYWVEAKVGKKQNIRAAMRQALEATDGRPVVAVVKDNSPGGGKAADTWACMTLDDWLDLVAELEVLKNERREQQESRKG